MVSSVGEQDAGYRTQRKRYDLRSRTGKRCFPDIEVLLYMDGEELTRVETYSMYNLDEDG